MTGIGGENATSKPAADPARIEMIPRPRPFSFRCVVFQSRPHLTLFLNGMLHRFGSAILGLEFVAFLWQMVAMFSLLLAGWELTGKCFCDEKARLAGVGLLAVLFTQLSGVTDCRLPDSGQFARFPDGVSACGKSGHVRVSGSIFTPCRDNSWLG